jgi:hypothetical protein
MVRRPEQATSWSSPLVVLPFLRLARFLHRGRGTILNGAALPDVSGHAASEPGRPMVRCSVLAALVASYRGMAAMLGLAPLPNP